MGCAQSFTDFKVIVSGYVDELEFLTWIKVADLMLKHFASIDAEIEVWQLLGRHYKPQAKLEIMWLRLVTFGFLLQDIRRIEKIKKRIARRRKNGGYKAASTV